MNKSGLLIALSILIVGLAAVGAFVYVNQANLAYEREKQEKKEEAAKTEALTKQQQDAEKSASYYTCVSTAEKSHDDNLKANSEYETKDANGETIYHGNANLFNQINQQLQDDKDRCVRLYQ